MCTGRLPFIPTMSAKYTMSRNCLIPIKVAGIVGLIWTAFCWLSFFVPWAARRSYVAPYIAFDVSIFVFGIVSACIAFILLTPKNFWRVLTNVLIIFAGFALGWIAGDPMTWGNYDHEGGLETTQGQLLFGPLGTLLGYGLTLLRESSRKGWESRKLNKA
jgi:hypothetical protein